jgi:hypothetical protein
MVYNSLWVDAFVEGKVQNRFTIISLALKKFIDQESPIIEDVNARLNIFSKQPFGHIIPAEMEEKVRNDAESARRSLINYNLTYGQVLHHLALASSNFNLPKFLQENGIPISEIQVFQEEVGQYWNQTYGLLVNRLSTVAIEMGLLASVLKKQVDLLEKIPNASYFVGFSHQHELIELFHQERDLFWKIAHDIKLTKTEVKTVHNLYISARNKTKSMILAHLKLLKNSFIDEVKRSETQLQKMLVVLSYLLGALNLFLNVEKNLIGKASGALGIFTAKKSINSGAIDRIKSALDELGVVQLTKLYSEL